MQKLVLTRGEGEARILALFSCARDFALIKGFYQKITLQRTQTIMEGAAYCDFCYTFKKGS